ncbi:hypothetical protein FLAVO9AF_30032 [Flavobacterium sp. 9AF]|nr:hypothetical protein [Flavobacterium sp. 9AF]VXB84172.1 hypothetical protein FLAVO9AF_30032 [Flavobacterium sp. 9AF]
MRTLDIQYNGQQNMNLISLDRSFSVKPSFDFAEGRNRQVHQYRQ